MTTKSASDNVLQKSLEMLMDHRSAFWRSTSHVLLHEALPSALPGSSLISYENFNIFIMKVLLLEALVSRSASY